MLNYLTNLVRPVSPWSLKVEKLSPPQPADLDSIPGFTQAVAQKLQSEAAQLKSGPGTPGVALFKGVFCSFLQSVPEYLDGLPHRSHQNRLLTLLDCLEALCQVRALLSDIFVMLLSWRDNVRLDRLKSKSVVSIQGAVELPVCVELKSKLLT